MKTNLNLRGGDFAYSAPTVDVMTVKVEQGFAASPIDVSWDSMLGNELEWGNNNQYE